MVSVSVSVGFGSRLGTVERDRDYGISANHILRAFLVQLRDKKSEWGQASSGFKVKTRYVVNRPLCGFYFNEKIILF